MSEEILRITDVTAEDVVRQCLTEYGVHTHRTKITNVIDGLKPVNRRILLVQDNTNIRKVTAITGSVMEKYHPYGDTAISDAITRMAQPFITPITLMYGNSNVGDYGGSKAAAARYLDLGASQFAVDVYFKGIDRNTFEYIPCETGTGDVEPKFLIPKLPMALLVANFGIALAHKSEPANLNLYEVCAMVEKYVQLKQLYGDSLTKDILYKKLFKYTLPDFPIKTFIRNKKPIMEYYENGEYKQSLFLDGTLTLTPTSIIIHTLPHGNKPKDAWQTLGLMRRENKSNIVNSSIQRIEEYNEAMDECNIILTLKRGTSPFDVLDKIKSLIGFTRKWTPTYLFTTPDDKIEYLDPISVLEYWYTERQRSIKAELRTAQRKNAEEIRKLTALIKIGDNIMDVVKILRDCSSVEEAYPILSQKYGLSKAQTVIIMQFRLSNIPKRSHSDMVAELNSIKEKMNELHLKFSNVNKQIAQDAESFRNKYPDFIRKCDEFKFIGCVSTMGGIIQYSSIDELKDILTRFLKQDIHVYTYVQNYKHIYQVSKTVIIEQDTNALFPKEFKCVGILSSRKKLKYTIVILDKCIYRVTNISIPTHDKKSKISYIDDRCIIVKSNGRVEQVDATYIPARNTLDAKGIRTDIIHVENLYDINSVIVVYTYEKNVIVFERVKVNSKFIIPPMSIAKTHIIGVYPDQENLVITVDDRYIDRCNTKHIHVVTTNSIIDRVEIKLTSKICANAKVSIDQSTGVYKIL